MGFNDMKLYGCSSSKTKTIEFDSFGFKFYLDQEEGRKHFI